MKSALLILGLILAVSSLTDAAYYRETGKIIHEKIFKFILSLLNFMYRRYLNKKRLKAKFEQKKYLKSSFFFIFFNPQNNLLVNGRNEVQQN
jgi:hypothetical protein